MGGWVEEILSVLSKSWRVGGDGAGTPGSGSSERKCMDPCKCWALSGPVHELFACDVEHTSEVLLEQDLESTWCQTKQFTLHQFRCPGIETLILVFSEQEIPWQPQTSPGWAWPACGELLTSGCPESHPAQPPTCTGWVLSGASISVHQNVTLASF